MESKFSAKVKEKSNELLLETHANSDDYQPDFVEAVETEILYRKLNKSFADLKIDRVIKEIKMDEDFSSGLDISFNSLVFGYFASAFGGLWGVIYGYQYAFTKRYNSDNKAFYKYNKKIRKHGERMLSLGILVMMIIIYLEVSQRVF